MFFVTLRTKGGGGGHFDPLLTTGEKYTKSYYENIMIFKEITTMCFLRIIKIMFLIKKSYCVFH